VPRVLDDLPQHVLVTYVQDLIFSNALDFMPELFAPRFRRIENASSVGQAEAVGAGAGIGILHDYHARIDPRVEMVLPELSFRRAYWIVTHEDTRDMLRVKTVTDFIAAEVDAARAAFVL
jgi:DNA-binding transcriptional LysR family regulator